MWKHYKIPGDDDDDCVIRPCGRFALYAGDVLLGHSELDREMIREDGAYRVGEFEPAWEGYLHFQPIFVRYNQLKLEQNLRLAGHKDLPELVASEREVQATALRLVAPNGEEVSTKTLEVADFGRVGDHDLEVFISEEPVYLRFFPLEAETT